MRAGHFSYLVVANLGACANAANFLFPVRKHSCAKSDRLEKFYRTGECSDAFFEIGVFALALLKPPDSVDIGPNSVPTKCTILQSGKYLAKAFLDVFTSELISTVRSDFADDPARTYVS